LEKKKKVLVRERPKKKPLVMKPITSTGGDKVGPMKSSIQEEKRNDTAI